jgi:pimeloyl-ACP methyl ester carboxylesterase
LAQSSNARHRLRRTVLAALVAVLAATLFTIAPAGASAPSSSGTGSAAVPRLDWGSCGDEPELAAFQCATAVVPLDYDRPKGKQIAVALARLPASGPGRKLGSLFLNPGGPGGSGVDFLFGAGPFLYSDEVRARFDLVGFDPRGIMRSTPPRCYETLDEALADRLRSAKGAYETLQEFLRLCDAGGPNCAFSEGNPARRFDRLAKRLLREPVEFTDPGSGETILVTYAELIGTTLGVLYDPFIWPEWAEILQQLYELTSPGAAAASLQAVRARLGAAFQQEDYPNFVEGFPGVACSETDNPSNVRAWSRAGRAQDRQFPYFGRPWTWISSICEPWPGWDDDRYAGPWNRTTANPVLVVNPLFDPATPYHGAVTVDRLLPRSRLLTLAGWGHTSLFSSACIDAHVSTYFLTTRVPAKGTVCEPDVVPFAEPAATAQALQAAGASSKTALIPPTLRRMLTD